MSSASLLALSLAPLVPDHKSACLGGGGGSWFAHLCFVGLSLSLRLRFPSPDRGGGGGLGPLSASSSLSPSYLTPGSPTPPSSLSTCLRLPESVCVSPSSPLPLRTLSVFPEPSTPAQTGSRPLGDRLPLLLGGREGEGGGGPSPGPGPAAPLPPALTLPSKPAHI